MADFNLSLLNFKFLLTIKLKSLFESKIRLSMLWFLNLFPNKFLNFLRSTLFFLFFKFPLTKYLLFFSLTFIDLDDNSISLKSIFTSSKL